MLKYTFWGALFASALGRPQGLHLQYNISSMIPDRFQNIGRKKIQNFLIHLKAAFHPYVNNLCFVVNLVLSLSVPPFNLV